MMRETRLADADERSALPVVPNRRTSSITVAAARAGQAPRPDTTFLISCDNPVNIAIPRDDMAHP